jgi:lysozyme family protein
VSFESAIKEVLKWEGGESITDDPRDPGGLTKYGISQRAFPSLNIRDLTEQQALGIYREHYWNRVRGDDLPEGVDLCVLDCAVNQGVSKAVKLLQRAVGASPDGVLGPSTMNSLRALKPSQVVTRFMQERAAAYLSTKGLDTYGRGWMNRLVDTTVKAARLAKDNPFTP